MKIQKTIYKGNGHNDNIAFIVSDGNTSIWLPALNKREFVDEFYETTIIDEGDHLYNQACACLQNDTSFEGLTRLEDAITKQKRADDIDKNISLEL